MTAHLRRLVFWGIPVLALVLALAFAFRPRPIDVDLTPVVRGPLIATVGDDDALEELRRRKPLLWKS